MVASLARGHAVKSPEAAVPMSHFGPRLGSPCLTLDHYMHRCDENTYHPLVAAYVSTVRPYISMTTQHNNTRDNTHDNTCVGIVLGATT